jgi:hypothetical protein
MRKFMGIGSGASRLAGCLGPAKLAHSWIEIPHVQQQDLLKQNCSTHAMKLSSGPQYKMLYKSSLNQV